VVEVDRAAMGSLGWRGSAESPVGQAVRRLVRNRGATAGGALLVALVGMATFAPLVARYDPIQTSYVDALAGPSFRHPLGTDRYGRDLFSRLVFGGRLSLTTGLIAVAIGASVGVLLGLPSGYYGGWLDDVVMRVMDVMLAFPGILFAMAIVAILGSGLTNVMIAVGISSIPGFVRLVRGSVLSAAEHVYVEAARALGCRGGRIMGLHLLPNIVAPLFTYATLRVSVAIISVASLNFLGLGAQPPTPEWGVMLADGRDHMRDYWWLATFPGLAIMATTLSINLFSNGLRDVLDPRLRRR
jgi:ABC-type dipeptide/oligopeptide/nickel transport system permease subunit